MDETEEREMLRELFQLPKYSFNGVPVYVSDAVPKDEVWFVDSCQGVGKIINVSEEGE